MSNREQDHTVVRATKSTMSGWRTKNLVAVYVLAGLIVVACMACIACSASADVDMTGALEKASPLGSSLGGVQPLASAANGDYKCIDKYSVVANWYYYYAIGNCPKGAEIEVVSYASENTETHEHSYGGFVNGSFSGCGWIDTRYPLEKQNGNLNSGCGEGSGNDFKIAESAFMAKHNGGSTGDGYAVVNKTSCPEYANYRPWSSNNVEKELIRTAPAYAASASGSNFPALKWRYTTKYNSTDGTGQYVMVRDDRISGGEGNWVFVPRSCLPSTLPENENERIPPKPAVTTEAASGVQTPSATLNGSVNPEGVATTYYFQYGTTTNWTESSTQAVEVGSGTSTLKESASIMGLAAGTTYYYRIVATSAIGTSEGSAQSFTMQPPPAVATNEATNVQQEQATISGTVNPNGLDTHYYFQYGLSAEYGLSTASTDAGSGTSGAPENATTTNLQPSRIYHYRIVASSAAGTSYGGDRSFETPRAAHPVIAPSGSSWNGIIWRGTDGNIYDTDAPSGEWESFSPTWSKKGIPSGVTVVGDPVIAPSGSSWSGIVWRGSDGNIYETDAPKGEWESFSPTWSKKGIPSGVTVGSDPVIAPYGTGSNGIIWRGTDGNIYDTDAPSGEWESFSPTWSKKGIPSSVTAVGDPVMARQGTSWSGIIWRGSDGNIYETDTPKGEWESYSPTWSKNGIPSGVTVGGDPVMAPYEAAWNGIMWHGTDGNIYDTDSLGGEWESFSPSWSKKGIPSGVTVGGDPVMAPYGTTWNGIMWRGTDGNIYETDAPKGEWESYSPTWSKKGVPAGVTMAVNTAP